MSLTFYTHKKSTGVWVISSPQIQFKTFCTKLKEGEARLYAAYRAHLSGGKVVTTNKDKELQRITRLLGQQKV